MKQNKKMLLGISLLLLGNCIGSTGSFFIYIEWFAAAIGFLFVLSGYFGEDENK